MTHSTKRQLMLHARPTVVQVGNVALATSVSWRSAGPVSATARGCAHSTCADEIAVQARSVVYAKARWGCVDGVHCQGMPLRPDATKPSARFSDVVGPTRGRVEPLHEPSGAPEHVQPESARMLGDVGRALDSLVAGDVVPAARLLYAHRAAESRREEGSRGPGVGTGSIGPLAEALRAVRLYSKALSFMEATAPLLPTLLERIGVRTVHADGLADHAGQLHVVDRANSEPLQAGRFAVCGRALPTHAPVRRGAWIQADDARRCRVCAQRPTSDCSETPNEPRIDYGLYHETVLQLCSLLRPEADDIADWDTDLLGWPAEGQRAWLVDALVFAVGQALALLEAPSDFDARLELWVGRNRLSRFLGEKACADGTDGQPVADVPVWSRDQVATAYTAVLRAAAHMDEDLGDAALWALENPYPF